VSSIFYICSGKKLTITPEGGAAAEFRSDSFALPEQSLLSRPYCPFMRSISKDCS
jgi:hypothetical protein